VATKPLDSRLAHRLVRPLAGTRVTPNQVTTLGLVVGLAAAALYACGGAAAHAGAALYVAAVVIDHADGELARMTGRTTPFGHRYDRLVDLTLKIAVFAGIGLGLRHGPLGAWAPVLGVLAGVAFVSIFALRSRLALHLGQAAFAQPSAGPVELEDILYLIAPLTWLGWLQPFLVAAAIGAPLFALWTASRLRAAGAGQRSNRRR